MARTKRRTQKHLIAERFGNLSQFLQNEYYNAPIMTHRFRIWQIECIKDKGYFVANGYQYAKYHGCMAIQVYQKKIAAFTGDTRSGLHGVPRWYRHEHGSHYNRRVEKQKLHLHRRRDEWEDHLPESRCRDAMYYWWY